MSEDTHTVLTADEAAELLRITPRKVVELARAGEIPGQRFGRDWRFLRSALEELLV